jgi:phosphinothricin acetyltransferase
MREIHFAPMTEAYLDEVTALLNHTIATSTALFVTAPLTRDEARPLVFFPSGRHKAFAVLRGTSFCGFVAVKPHSSLSAYADTAEVSVYFAPGCTGRGLGGLSVQYIENYALLQGFHALLAIITAENAPSVRMFEKIGYAKCAHYKEIGRKFGRWLDVVAYEKILSEGRT